LYVISRTSKAVSGEKTTTGGQARRIKKASQFELCCLFLRKKEEPPSSGRLPSINSKLQLHLYVTDVCLAMQLWFFQQAGFLLFRVIRLTRLTCFNISILIFSKNYTNTNLNTRRGSAQIHNSSLRK